MRKPLHIWLIFLACFGLLALALAWVARHTLALEQEREAAAREAETQERVRLALWRLDFQASALMLRENARPPHDFRPFHAPEGLVSKSLSNVAQGEVLVPSSLLADIPEHVLLHFQMNSRGQVVSPQVPLERERELALQQFLRADALQLSEKRLNDLRVLLAQPAAPQPPSSAAATSASASTSSNDAPSDKSRQAAVKPSAPQLNRQVLAAAACVTAFDFTDNTPVTSGYITRNSAWNTVPTEGVSQQLALNNTENVMRSRAFQMQSAEAVKLQQGIKLIEPPSPKVAEKKPPVRKAATGDLQIPLQEAPRISSTRENKVDDGNSSAPAPSSGIGGMAAAAAAPQPAAAPSKEAPPTTATVRVEPAGAALAMPKPEERTAERAQADASHPFRGVWLGENLVLTREVVVEGVRLVQGVWLDWPALRTAWLKEITDLFPEAVLEPAATQDLNARPTDDPLRFAALPVRLVPTMGPLPPLPFWTPLRRSLGIAMACVLLAGAAVGLVLYGTVALSERRAAFVSAVTHELRTPLTTFRLYSEMLADGMVADEAQRKTYLDTLSGEAGRLSHLVENVLAYARLERGSGKARAENITIGALLDRMLPRLSQRAGECGMEVRVHATAGDRAAELHVDAAAVEQILFNLVDNACKYAAPRASEPIIHVEADTRGKFAMLRVRDHGGGIPRGERRRIFHPFHKSADQAAHSAPGVGLGLALCRRLATALGGAITLDTANKDGACFVLRLPK